MQFDTQASDGVVTGMSYEQTIRPFQAEDPQITQDAAMGDTTLSLSSVTKFQAGEWIAAGLATEDIEIRQIASIDAAAKTITLTKPLEHAHAAGQYAGVEFVQYRWYPDVQLDNIFFHTHVDGIHDWGHGLVGQLIIEPKGSTYHDPQTGAEVDSGTIVDIHTNQDANDPRTELAPGLVNGSFREMALWTIDENPGGRLHAQPAGRAMGRQARAERRLLAALQLVCPRRPVHAAAAGLRRRPVRDPDDQRERQRRHAARRRQPVLPREPLRGSRPPG